MLALTVVVTLIVGVLAGCGRQVAPRSGGTFTPVADGTLTVAVDRVPQPGFWLGTAAAPTGGFEHGLALALVKRLGLDDLRVVEVPLTRIVDGDLGGADVAISDVTATDDRDRNVDFSVPYLSAVPGILVHAGTKVPDVHTARELRWAVERGTTLETALAEQIRPDDETLVTDTERAAVAALRERRVEAVMLDLPVALAYAHGSAGRYTVAAQLPGDEQLAVVLPKGSDNRDAIDSAIRAIRSDGTIDALARQWLGTDLQDGQVDDVLALRTKGGR